MVELMTEAPGGDQESHGVMPFEEATVIVGMMTSVGLVSSCGRMRYRAKEIDLMFNANGGPLVLFVRLVHSGQGL